MACSRFHICFLISCLALSSPISSQEDICLPKSYAPLFVFGDSLFDVGNNNYINTTADYQANFSPYGETFFKYPSGRYCDGRMIPDFIAQYANLPLIQPNLFPGVDNWYINGVNFASGGAGALAETNKGFVIDLNTQVSFFRNISKLLQRHSGEEETKYFLSKAVYLITIGGNDYPNSLNANSTASQTTELVEMVIGNLTTVIKEIYKIGGRKFAFLNLPPVGCVPLFRALVNGSTASGCLEEYNSVARLHNTALSKMLEQLQKQLKGFRYSVTNFYDTFLDIINNPSKYGFKEVKAGCCGTGPYRGTHSCGGKGEVKHYELCDSVSDYVFFDSSHLTEKAYQHFSQLMWNGDHNVTAPYNIKELFAM